MGRVRRARLAGVAMVGLMFAGVEIALVSRPVVAQQCTGDCDADGEVEIADLIIGVNIALGRQPVSQCAAMDTDNNGEVAIQELIRAVTAALEGCPSTATVTPTVDGATTVTVTAEPTATTPVAATSTVTGEVTETPSDTPTVPPVTVTPGPSPFCSLPGSVQNMGPGLQVVPGGATEAPDLSFISLPMGYCVHYFGNVRNTRELRFAPNGDLFVASPSKFSTSNAQNGRAEIVILPDDDGDGSADSVLTYLEATPPECRRECVNGTCGNGGGICVENRCQSPLSETVGLLFANGFFYFQDRTRILRVPYSPGDRTATGTCEEVVDIEYSSFLHWPKAIDMADDGTIYVTNGGDETDPCPPEEVRGSIWKIDGSPNGALVAKGFRNPISLRCVAGHNKCFAIELTRDYSTPLGGREKLVPVRDGDDWGFPCCATKDRPYDDRPGPDCSGVAEEIGSFFVGNTPFDVDYELGRWPAPWGNRAYVPIHGAYGSWAGARIVGIELDAMTGQVLPGSDLSGASMGAMDDFATGWDPEFLPDATREHGRPTAVAFAPDGRMFMGNDFTGDIIWIAPATLAPEE